MCMLAQHLDWGLQKPGGAAAEHNLREAHARSANSTAGCHGCGADLLHLRHGRWA